ncbi:MAG: cellulose binding domain-containing protein, partial [Terracidiphilus sp.]
QGASGTDTITVTDVSPFTGSVTFAASGMPTGVTASFSPASSATSSVLTLSVSSTVAAGNYLITITGTSGSLTASTSVTLTVTSTSGNYCHVVYTIGSQWPGGFGAAITIDNTGTANWTSWTLTWSFANGQTVTELWNGNETQSGANVTVTNMSYNGSIAAGSSYNGMGFNGSWNNTTNAVPTAFAVNGHACN